MKVKKAWFVPVSGNSKDFVRLPQLEGKELSFKDMYPIIGNGCHIVERVALTKGVDMWVDEEGLLKANPVINGMGTFLYQHEFSNGHGINPAMLAQLGVVGNAIIIDNTAKGEYITN